jgi:hypothetical protein
MKKLLGIIERIKKANAIGIIYNLSKQQAALLQNRLLDSRQVVVIRGKEAYTPPMLMFRLKHQLKMKLLTIDKLTDLLDGKLILINEADMLKPSYNKVLEEFNRCRIPLILLFNNGHAVKNFRKLPVYNQILTIEQDYHYL